MITIQESKISFQIPSPTQQPQCWAWYSYSTGTENISQGRYFPLRGVTVAHQESVQTKINSGSWAQTVQAVSLFSAWKYQFHLATQKGWAVFCKLKSYKCFSTVCYINIGKYLDFQYLQLRALLKNFQQKGSSKRFTGRMLKNSECPKDRLDQTTDILLTLLPLFFTWAITFLLCQ